MVCEFSEEEKQDFLIKARDLGIRNIEMECTFMAAITSLCNLKCACVCVTLLDRLKGDQVLISPSEYKDFNQRPQILIARFISQSLQLIGDKPVEPVIMLSSNDTEKRKSEEEDELTPPAPKRRREEIPNSSTTSVN